VFTGKPRGHGRVALEIELAALHISFRHSRAYHPQTCGKVERYHQTLKKWLARQPPAATLAILQAQLDWFTSYYNTRRPHRALGRATPAAAFAAQQRAALTLRYLDDLPVAEVAAHLGRTLHATETLLARARTALRRVYQE
jgi:integrase-like protein/sigma-70-like protein